MWSRGEKAQVAFGRGNKFLQGGMGLYNNNNIAFCPKQVGVGKLVWDYGVTKLRLDGNKHNHTLSVSSVIE
jgi:hypothetical protein